MLSFDLLLCIFTSTKHLVFYQTHLSARTIEDML